MIGLLLLACSATFLLEPRITCPGTALPTVGWALLHQIAVKKTLPWTCLKANLMEAMLPLRFPFPRFAKLTANISHGVSILSVQRANSPAPRSVGMLFFD